MRQQVRWWNLLGQAERTTAVFDQAVGRWPAWSDGVEGLAFALAQAKQHAKAIALLHALVQREPLRAQAWFNLGFLLQQSAATGEPGETGTITAEVALRQASQLDQRHDRAWYGLALELIAQRRLAEAVPCLKSCTQIQPMSPYAWYQLGRVHHEMGDTREALLVLNHLKTFDPKVSGQLQREFNAVPAATTP
jgi:tetratricopeptide (TPR) repeat protein